METEIKLSIDTAFELEALYEDPRLEILSISTTERRSHHSVYFDTGDGYLDSCGISLRLRRESCGGVDDIVCCLKKKGKDEHDSIKIREEYEYTVPREHINEGMFKKFPVSCIEGLAAVGIDESTVEKLRRGELIPSAEVKYTRSVRLLRVSADTVCELALDEGIFASGERFKEAELELKRGNVEDMQMLAAYLMRKYKMKAQPLSKHDRAHL